MHRPNLINATIGEYRIVDFLGAGGMGEVYRAVHNKIGRTAAVKVLTQTTNSDGMLDRFFNEARIQASLHHPNIATLYDFIELNGQPCIIMEYVDGQTLADRVRPGGPLALAETIYIFQSVVEAITYIHNHGVIHRDIKSNNIKIGLDGQVKLLDFGIAKADASPGLTATGSVIGTLEYISPEQLTSGVADARSDIWALGVLLYEMVTGRVPFEAVTLGELCKKINKVDYPPVTVLNPAVPREVSAIITRCLRKNPMDRYRLAQDLLEDVKHLRELVPTPQLSGVKRTLAASIRAKRESLSGSTWKILTALAASVVLVVGFMLGLYLFTGGSSTTATSEETNKLQQESAIEESSGDSLERSIKIAVFEGEADVCDLDGRVLKRITSNEPYEFKANIGDIFNFRIRRDGDDSEPKQIQVTANKDRYTY